MTERADKGDPPDTSTASAVLRPIESRDDAAVAEIIRRVMPEFGADGPGFAIHDPEVDHMFEAYSAPRARYIVVERDGAIVGGGGFAPLAGGDPEVCELRKMYFLPEARGIGVGSRLLASLLTEARDAGFATCYLETLSGMDAAQRLYERAGFLRREAPLGCTGHFACDRWYARPLR